MLYEVITKRSSVIEGSLTVDDVNNVLDELAANMGKSYVFSCPLHSPTPTPNHVVTCRPASCNECTTVARPRSRGGSSESSSKASSSLQILARSRVVHCSRITHQICRSTSKRQPYSPYSIQMRTTYTTPAPTSRRSPGSSGTPHGGSMMRCASPSPPPFPLAYALSVIR